MERGGRVTEEAGREGGVGGWGEKEDRETRGTARADSGVSRQRENPRQMERRQESRGVESR